MTATSMRLLRRRVIGINRMRIDGVLNLLKRPRLTMASRNTLTTEAQAVRDANRDIERLRKANQHFKFIIGDLFWRQ